MLQGSGRSNWRSTFLATTSGRAKPVEAGGIIGPQGIDKIGRTAAEGVGGDRRLGVTCQAVYSRFATLPIPPQPTVVSASQPSPT